jgi:hypothetical protein
VFGLLELMYWDWQKHGSLVTTLTVEGQDFCDTSGSRFPSRFKTLLSFSQSFWAAFLHRQSNGDLHCNRLECLYSCLLVACFSLGYATPEKRLKVYLFCLYFFFFCWMKTGARNIPLSGGRVKDFRSSLCEISLYSWCNIYLYAFQTSRKSAFFFFFFFDFFVLFVP